MNIELFAGDIATFAIRAHIEAIFAEQGAYVGWTQCAVGGQWFGSTSKIELLNAEWGAFDEMTKGPVHEELAEVLWSMSPEDVLVAVDASMYSREHLSKASIPTELSKYAEGLRLAPLGPGFNDSIIVSVPKRDQSRVCAANGLEMGSNSPVILKDVHDVILESTRLAETCAAFVAQIPAIPGRQFSWSR